MSVLHGKGELGVAAAEDEQLHTHYRLSVSPLMSRQEGGSHAGKGYICPDNVGIQ